MEIFDEEALSGEWIEKMGDAMNEFKDRTNGWKKILTNQELMTLNIYKLNKEWANMIKANGYTILDMGDFNNKGFSVFYAMEKSVIFK